MPFSNPIMDTYTSYFDLKRDIMRTGPHRIQSMFAIDFSKSNQWQGEKTRAGLSLHDLSKGNPYLEILDILIPALEDFDSDGIVPVYRFGCNKSKDKYVVPLENEKSCEYEGLENVKEGYIRVATTPPRMSGPTSFRPIINCAIEYAKQFNNQQFILCIIITDGDVDDVDADKRALSEASNYPIAFTAIGVGDGPFDKMCFFDDFTDRRFDNFQFACYQDMRQRLMRMEEPEAELALHMLMEIPECFDQMTRLGIIQRM